LLTSSGIFEELDFLGRVSSSYRREVKLRVEREGQMNGLLVWLNLYTDEEAEVIDILEHEHCWLPVYMPVFESEVEVREGDEIVAEIRGEKSENGLNPDYEIRGEVRHRDVERWRSLSLGALEREGVGRCFTGRYLKERRSRSELGQV
jgi:hypothetical protein